MKVIGMCGAVVLVLAGLCLGMVVIAMRQWDAGQQAESVATFASLAFAVCGVGVWSLKAWREAGKDPYHGLYGGPP